MTHEELIAALEAAPTGTRELGVAVLKAVGARIDVWSARWFIRPEGDAIIFLIAEFDEARVVTDLNFRLPGVPEGWIRVRSPQRKETYWHARLWVYDDNDDDGGTAIYAHGHTERLARCIAELKAVLAVKGKEP